MIFFPAGLIHAEPNQEATKAVSISKMKPLALKAGKAAEALVKIRIEKGFHIQANPASPRMIPTTLKLEPVAGITLGEPVYPKGESFRLKSLGMEALVYHDAVEVKVPLTVSAEAAGKKTMKGKLRFQACNETFCFMPANLPVGIPVTISKE